MNKPSNPLISKSKYLDGLSCQKLLWYWYNRKEQIPPPDPLSREVMKQGKVVGEYARRLFPEGTLIDFDPNPANLLKKTGEALKKRKPLFEAGFSFKQGYCLADILLPAEGDAWDLIEVKSSADTKPEHYRDVAFQKYVIEGSGLKIHHSYLMHLNKNYVRMGELDLNKLFRKVDISDTISSFVPEIEMKIQEMLAVIPEGHIFILRSGKKVAFDLLERGILKMKDIPKDFELSEKHEIQVETHKSNRAYVDRESIKTFLGELSYPLYFLDFETIAPAIPLFDYARPYEDLPFQFSLHVIEEKGTAPIHHTFLSHDKNDPRPAILERLKKLLGKSGSIVAYNAKYEKSCIENAARPYEEYQKWFEEISGRFVDLLVPFKNLLYYHPLQEGSASMKDVLPALTGITYEGMGIGDGLTARLEYSRVTFEKEVDETERRKVYALLEKYCELDTRGMIEILKALEENSA
jgi:hypothetical protein